MKLAAVGDNCIDVYDKTGEAYTGGNPVNVAVFFKRLGGQSSYTGVIGNDKYGRIMKTSLENKGIDVSHLHVKSGNTAVTHVERINGERVFGEYDEGVLKNFTLSKEDINFLCNHDLVVSALWGKVENQLEIIHKRGVKIAYDSATRPFGKEGSVAMQYADYFFFSSDNEEVGSLKEKMIKIFNKGSKVVIATLGEDGSLAYDGKKFITCGVEKCKVVDTMGAGDSYIAGFIKGILEKSSIEDSMKLGAFNSSITIGYKGTW